MYYIHQTPLSSCSVEGESGDETIPWDARQAAQCSQMAETQNYPQCLKLFWVRAMHEWSYSNARWRFSTWFEWSLARVCVAALAGKWLHSHCVVTCMVCFPQPTTKSRVCCSLNIILHFCIWIWSSLVCAVLVCEGWIAQTYCGKTVGKDGSMKVKTHQIQCTTVYDRKKQYLFLQSLPDLTPILHPFSPIESRYVKLRSLVLSPRCLWQRYY